MTWENRGVAPAYHSFQLILRLSGPKTHTVTMDAGNLNWLPNKKHKADYTASIPADLPPGKYQLALKLYSPRVVELYI